tara:strand:+ start:25 stop:918 length:894 start_codon:yes stop_codon:yes gene_type:complete
MKKEDLIRKWLDHSLSEEEWKAFKKLDAFPTLEKMDELAKDYRAPRVNVEEHFAGISTRKSLSTSNALPWKRIVGGIAAALLIGLFLFYGLTPSLTTQKALATETKKFILPDASEVILNAESQISYQEDLWQENRTLQLNGEAYFDVSKGTTFTVETPTGYVTVLGTQFNVISRNDILEVICFEGRVKVTQNSNEMYLSAGQAFSTILNSSIKEHELSSPTWVQGISRFESAPFYFVASEMERQYNIKITYPQTIENSLFTGSFSDKNLEAALQAITIPFNLEYSIKGTSVMLKQLP